MVISEGMDQFAAHRLGDAGSIADLLYECYASKASMDNETIRESFYVVEKCTEGMPYELSDRISAAMVSACVECTSGFSGWCGIGGKADQRVDEIMKSTAGNSGASFVKKRHRSVSRVLS